MATGRGWIHQQYNEWLQKEKQSPEAPAISKKAPKATSAKVPPRRNYKNAMAVKSVRHSSYTSSNKTNSYIESFPSEVLLKIFSYLDPASLLCVGCTNKRLYQLSNDNIIWYRICSTMIRSLCWKFKSVDSETELLSNTTLEDKQLGYWKKTYIGHIMTGRQNRLNYVLKSLENCSGVPGTSQIAKAIKLSGLKWTITLRDTKGKEFVFEQMDIFFKENSLSLLWYGTQLYLLASLTTIQLHGVTSAIFDKSMRPMKNGPRTRSLVAEYDLRNLDNSVHIGEDRLVNLLFHSPGLLLGIWKASSDLAFVMVTHHYHQLIEKSILGTTDLTFTIPLHVPILDDIDPNYGLHGYQLHIDMHSGPRTYFCETFPGLFCRREYIKNGFLRLSVIGIKNSKQHAPLAGKVGLLWRTDTFECYMKNCFILDITLLDGNKNPFWCISAPVNIRKSRQQDLLFDFMGQNYFLKYKDPLGTIYADLVWMKETEEFYIVCMTLHLNTDKVNSWFGTHY